MYPDRLEIHQLGVHQVKGGILGYTMSGYTMHVTFLVSPCDLPSFAMHLFAAKFKYSRHFQADCPPPLFGVILDPGSSRVMYGSDPPHHLRDYPPPPHPD